MEKKKPRTHLTIRHSPFAIRHSLFAIKTEGTMPFDLVVRGGNVVLPQTDGLAVDIAISEEKIAAILAPGTEVDAADLLDATDKVVLPGVVDVHLHLGHGRDIARPRVPDDAATETAAAA